jgi:hypothetical protein
MPLKIKISSFYCSTTHPNNHNTQTIKTIKTCKFSLMSMNNNAKKQESSMKSRDKWMRKWEKKKKRASVSRKCNSNQIKHNSKVRK